MARRGGARAQSRPKSTIEGGQSLSGRLAGVLDARRRHIGGGEKGAEAPSRCWSARSQTVGCAHQGAGFSGSMGRLAPARPAGRRQRACGRAQPDQDEAGDGLRHSHDQPAQRPFQLRAINKFTVQLIHKSKFLKLYVFNVDLGRRRDERGSGHHAQGAPGGDVTPDTVPQRQRGVHRRSDRRSCVDQG